MPEPVRGQESILINASPEVVYDLPAGGLVQRAQSYRDTFVAEAEALRENQHSARARAMQCQRLFT